MHNIVSVFVVYTAWCLLDGLNMLWIYEKCLQFEKRPVPKKCWFWVALMLGISYLYGSQQIPDLFHKGISDAINLPYFFKLLLLIWCFYPRRKKDVLLVVLYQLLVITISQQMYLLIKTDTVGFHELFFMDLFQVAAAALITVCLMLIHFFQKNNILKIYFEELSTAQCVWFCVVLLITNLIEACIFVLYPGDLFLRIASGLNVIVICALVVHFIVIRESETRKGRMIAFCNEQMEKMSDCYQVAEQREIQTKKFRHDIKNLLLVLYSMVEQQENEQALEYIEKMSAICKNITPKYDTGNYVANTLLTAKCVAAEKCNTEIVFQGCIPQEVESVDLVILLSNMLDNALEACEKVEGKKSICIDSSFEKQIWVITVRNPTAQVVKIRKNRAATTKQNKELHGYGLQNMERVVKKYEGSLNLACSDGIFDARASLIFNTNA